MTSAIDLFVRVDNQTLLWEVIQTSRLFASTPDPEPWFAEMIGRVYEADDAQAGKTLRDLNERAILLMLADLDQTHNLQGAAQQQQEQQQQSFVEQQQLAFVEKDNELRSQTTKDEPIKNMEELLLTERMKRDKEIPVFQKPTGDVI